MPSKGSSGGDDMMMDDMMMQLMDMMKGGDVEEVKKVLMTKLDEVMSMIPEAM